MNNWIETTLGQEIELAYGKSLPAQNRQSGRIGVFGSNGLVGTHNMSCVDGPGIIVGRKGSVGEITFSAQPFWPIDTTYYVVNKKNHNWRFLFHLLRYCDLTGLNSHSAVPGLNREDAYSISVRLPLRNEQNDIATALDCIENAIRVESDGLKLAQKLKKSAMRELFTRGLNGEEQKETEIGLIPKSWKVDRLDNLAKTISTRMSYTELAEENNLTGNSLRVLGVKVSDMNRDGNESLILTAALEKMIDKEIVEYRCAPPNTIIFPKRGAAIATNKKRLTTTWTVFDPNVIGVIPTSIDSEFLFQWFQNFDLRTITEPGPTPQLNKKHLDPLLIPVPSTLDEQKNIANLFNAIDKKLALHREKFAILEELFKSLLQKLMTGEIRVSELDLTAVKDTSLNEASV